MLDQETKKKINDLRDTLVGKVPDPKSQVEQIMIALIYKFMNDMDKESTDLGGEASFFVGDFEKYSWDNLFGTKVSGSELVDLYSTAVESMEENPNIPQLFRDIFKNAYIPYKDAETLRLFLSQIDDFEYSKDSEQLGDAFEHILNSLSSQGDAGQFRTPRHIIDFIVEIVDPKKDETVLDPASGTSGFLISAFKHIVNSNSEKSSGDLLSATERKKIMENINGYDISPDMVRIGLANMYLHGFPEPNVVEYDALTSEDRWNEYYDVILANPPFMTPKGGIRPHNKFGFKSNRAEVLFVDYILTHLKPKGRAGIIVPEGIIFQSGKAYKELRKKLVENGLFAVVSLPSGVFKPYSGVKTSILLIDKSNKSEKIVFEDVRNDGFSLGDKRVPITKNDIPKILESLQTDNSESFINKSEILSSENLSLTFQNYKNFSLNTSYNSIKLSEFLDLKNGYAFKSSDYVESSNILNFRMSQIRPDGKVDLNYNPKFLPDSFADKYDEFSLQSGDIVIAMTDMASDPKILGVPTEIPKSNKKLLLNQRVGKFIFLNEDLILKKYLALILKSKEAKNYFLNLGQGGVQINLSKKDILNLQIPLPPLEKQQEIVDEIEQYQKVIDGARQVVQNMRTNISVDTSWEMVAIGEICNISSGGTPSKKNDEYWVNGDIPWVGSTVCKDKKIYSSDKFITKIGLENSSAKIFPVGTTLVALVGATIGKTAFNMFETATNQNIAGLISKDDTQLNNEYLFYALQTLYPKFIELGEKNFRMANQKFVKELKIPLPSLEIQNRIVLEMNDLEKIIEQNKRIVTIYNQKINEFISKLYK